MNKGLLDQLAVQSFILLGYFWKKKQLSSLSCCSPEHELTWHELSSVE